MNTDSDDDFESPSQTSKRLKKLWSQNMLPLTQGDLWPGFDNLIARNPLGWVLPLPEGVDGVPIPQTPVGNVSAQVPHQKSHDPPQVLPAVQPLVLPQGKSQVRLADAPVSKRPGFLESVMQSVDVDLPDIHVPKVRPRPSKQSASLPQHVNNPSFLQLTQVSVDKGVEPRLTDGDGLHSDSQIPAATINKLNPGSQGSQLQRYESQNR